MDQILKIEDCNFDQSNNPTQLFGAAVSAKRYVVYRRNKKKIQIVKPSEHGLGVVFVPDKRNRYKPENCKDKESSYSRWIVEAWEKLLSEHFRMAEDPERTPIARELWFDKFTRDDARSRDNNERAQGVAKTRSRSREALQLCTFANTR